MHVPASRRTWRYALLFGLCGLANVLAGGAQSTNGDRGSEPVATVRVKSNLVILDVVATDQAGRVVADLKKEDFRVFENGVPQTIRTLESPGAQPAIPVAATLDRNGHGAWGESPITLVVLDQLNTPMEEIAYSRDQFFKYIRAQPPLLAEPTSLIVLNDRGIQSATPATRDRDALLKIAQHEPVGLPFKLKKADSEELLSKSFALLRQIARSRRGDHGRKNVIWVGRGFPGLDPTTLTERDRESFLKAVHNTVDLLLEARVAVYKIDPRSTAEGAMDSGLDATGLDGPMVADDPFATSFSFNAFNAQTATRAGASARPTSRPTMWPG